MATVAQPAYVQELIDAAAPCIDEADAIDQLRALHGAKDSEAAHEAADVILLRLIGSPEIAEAFARVNRWYA